MPEQNIHVMFLEDLKSNTAYELKKCFEFLEVNTQYSIPEQNPQLKTIRLKTPQILKRNTNYWPLDSKVPRRHSRQIRKAT